jgi:hypothetical protein
MMGKFSAAVESLLDLYSNCLEFLENVPGAKDARRRGRKSSSNQGLLCKSIASDREIVRRAYTASLYSGGRRFDKGDGMWIY